MEGKLGALSREGLLCIQGAPGDPWGSCCTCEEEQTGSAGTTHPAPAFLPSVTFNPCCCCFLVWGEKEGLGGRGQTFSNLNTPHSSVRKQPYPLYLSSGQFLAPGASRDPRTGARNTKGFSSLMRRHL